MSNCNIHGVKTMIMMTRTIMIMAIMKMTTMLMKVIIMEILHRRLLLVNKAIMTSIGKHGQLLINFSNHLSIDCAVKIVNKRRRCSRDDALT